MKLPVLKFDGSTENIPVEDSVFGIEPNEAIVHQAVQAELANLRQGTHAAKSRGMVRGGGRKPFRQKGRGVARAGSTRSPLWPGGGVVFGPLPHLYKKKLNRKMKQIARKSVLSDKVASGQVKIFDEVKVDHPRTAEFAALLKQWELEGKVVTFLLGTVEPNLILASQNIPNVLILKATDASTYDILDNEVLVFDKSGLALLNEQLKKKAS